ncbi:bacterial regulatory helix-turn-helix, lysR family protein [Burkholderia cenocepacia]|uniref:Bacterial regulatory helix-turn-helix, lysR family protein n=1 Tax=Burkholderia cenocepacia TaxID=95486 RepID=A0AAN0RX11_9BURK|nr:bacterial regulatory helix-turn-helix, lysR family protein [Burkholderia cenocepacia]
MTRTPSVWMNRIGRRMKLRDLYILSAVVRWGSMAKAASHLGMSQPAVSEAIANLEAALGVRLLNRHAQGVESTIYADALLKRGQVVFDELMQGINDIEFLANPEVGEVRIACAEFLSADFLPRAISLFSQQYPHVVFSVVQQDTTTLENRELQERIVDIVLARVPSDFVDDDMNVEVLFNDPHCIVAGENSSWARRHNISLAEIANEPWIIPPSSIIEKLVRAEFERRNIKLNASVNSASILLRNQLLATGRYISVLPLSLVSGNAKQWSITALEVDDIHLTPPPISLITLKRRTLSPVVERFVEHVRNIAKSMNQPAHSSEGD